MFKSGCGDTVRESLVQSLIVYETPRLVRVHNVWLGVLIRYCQVAVVAYVLTYAIWFEKGYQVIIRTSARASAKMESVHN